MSQKIILIILFISFGVVLYSIYFLMASSESNKSTNKNNKNILNKKNESIYKKEFLDKVKDLDLDL
ncbi:MAG: hypothetical protein VW238_00385 [Nitrosomonadales bacterium]|jgi:CHASE3 domain sensor protein